MNTPFATITEDELAELEQLANAATPGRWQKRTHPQFPSFIQAPRLNPDDPYDIELLGDDETLYPTRNADLDYIVAAQPEILKRLVQALRQARKTPG